ncbi:MAG: hypothetical protein AAGA86_11410, partial [Bacteroidota bacterium]
EDDGAIAHPISGKKHGLAFWCTPGPNTDPGCSFFPYSGFTKICHFNIPRCNANIKPIFPLI